MAQVLAAPGHAESRIVPGWWPVDLLMTAYLCATGLLLVLFWGRIPGAGWLAAWHVLAPLVIGWQARTRKPSWTFRHWYPLLYIPICYREMGILIPAIRGTNLDTRLAALDFAIWGAHPAVWLERIQTPLATEFLQAVYSLFVPMVLVVAGVLWRKRRFEHFRYYAFLVAMGFLTSYIGYLLVPARGPRFLPAVLPHAQLEGLWLFHPLQRLLDQLESAHYDAFPSGHTELILLAWWSSRKISPRLFRVLSVYSVFMIFATVYLRYHYTVDLFAGAALALALLAVTPGIYQTMRAWIGRS